MTVSGPLGQYTTDAVVDPSASFTSVPAPALIEMGIQPHRVVRLQAGDGKAHFRQLGRALTTVAGLEDVTPVMFGEPGEPVLIGATTLAILLLRLDPATGGLLPIEAMRGFGSG
jgi:predicted aspartyl protease